MLKYNICTMYFSPTGTTCTIVRRIADRLEKNAGEPVTIREYDFTLPSGRREAPSFNARDLLIIGVPVYAGRVPNVLLSYLNIIIGSGALVVPVVLYGNRDYDDALLELKDILESNGFTAVAAAAFVGEHSFSKILGADRPDANDIMLADTFADQVYHKLTMQNEFESVRVKGNRPYRKYYTPRDENGAPVTDFRLITRKRVMIVSIARPVPKSVQWVQSTTMMSPVDRDLHQMLCLYKRCHPGQAFCQTTVHTP